MFGAKVVGPTDEARNPLFTAVVVNEGEVWVGVGDMAAMMMHKITKSLEPIGTIVRKRVLFKESCVKSVHSK